MASHRRRQSIFRSGKPGARRAARGPNEAAGVARLLKAAGIRPTRQRIDLMLCLLRDMGYRVTPEQLHAKAQSAGVRVALATVYNTLNRLAEHGLLRRIVADGRKTFFDPDPRHHSHLYFEDTGELRDLPDYWFSREEISRRLGGIDADRIEVLVRVRPGTGGRVRR